MQATAQHDQATFEPAIINLPAKGTLFLTFYTDPGHGWLEVPHYLMQELKVIPTPYSYKNYKFSYLEEDCDASAFMEAAKAAGYTVHIKHVNEPRGDSFVRSLARWH